jgi:protein SCO1/2
MRLLLLVLMASAAAAQEVAPPPPAPPSQVFVEAEPRPIEDFALTDQDGRQFRFSSLRGAPALVFFGFAHCPDICPNTLLKLRRLMDLLPEELSDTRVVMISVDGDRDTPQLLKEYLGAFRPDFIGLSGPPAQVRDIAARFPAVFVKGIPPTPGGAYSVQHSSLIYALDRAGNVRVKFGEAEVEEMADSLENLDL